MSENRACEQNHSRIQNNRAKGKARKISVYGLSHTRSFSRLLAPGSWESSSLSSEKKLFKPHKTTIQVPEKPISLGEEKKKNLLPYKVRMEKNQENCAFEHPGVSIDYRKSPVLPIEIRHLNCTTSYIHV